MAAISPERPRYYGAFRRGTQFAKRLLAMVILFLNPQKF